MIPPGYRRLFIALPVPPETGKLLTGYCVSHPHVHWIPAPNRHLTLAFLGHRTEEQTRRAVQVVEAVDASPFELRLTSLQRFPDDRGRNVAALPARCPPLESLQEQLAAALTAQGFTLKQRDFRPHITLGKIHRGQWPAVELEPPIIMAVNAVTLFQTEFVDNGVTYHILTTRQLG